MVSYSGKTVNDLGFYKYCLTKEDFTYLLVGLKPESLIFDLNLIFLGLCLPNQCTTESLEVFTPLIKQLEPSLGLGPLEIRYTEVKEETPIYSDLSNGAIFMLSVMGVVGLFVLFGIVVHYTPLFSRKSAEEEPNVEKRKTKLGRIFLSFSILLNFKKLFNTSQV